jgi:fructokinase
MILSCGDALIDFVPAATAQGREALMPAVGGSCFNVAVGLARLGAPTGFVGGLSTDLWGTMIAGHAAASDVDLRYATRSADQTTLAFVRIVAGESHYAFYDAGSAARHWTYPRGRVPLGAVDALHVGSTTLVHDQGAAQTRAMVADASPTVTIAFDPNCRPNLVQDRAAYQARMADFGAMADIIKMSDVDFDFLQGHDRYAERAAAWLSAGRSLVVVTRGASGALAWHKNAGLVEIAAPAVDVVDTIGAGDSFQAGLLFALHRLGRIRKGQLAALTSAELRRVLTFAAACAARTCTRPGADPPRWSEMAASWEALA